MNFKGCYLKLGFPSQYQKLVFGMSLKIILRYYFLEIMFFPPNQMLSRRFHTIFAESVNPKFHKVHPSLINHVNAKRSALYVLYFFLEGERKRLIQVIIEQRQSFLNNLFISKTLSIDNQLNLQKVVIFNLICQF